VGDLQEACKEFGAKEFEAPANEGAQLVFCRGSALAVDVLEPECEHVVFYRVRALLAPIRVLAERHDSFNKLVVVL